MDRLFDKIRMNNNRSMIYCGVGVLLTGWVANKLWSLHMSKLRKTIRKRIREYRDVKVAQLSGLHLDDRLISDIAGLSAVELAGKVRSGELAAVDVLKAYQLLALEAHRKTNCLSNVIEEAEEIAQELDARNVDEREGLLYGVPISIKDNINTKGNLNSGGTLNYCENYPLCDDLVIEMLKAEGAIPFVKTNIPQLAMSFDTTNAIYGTTLNPLDITRTPGGSSGGEAALLAAGGSPLGVGTDIAGSVRVPAAFTGICSLKPTAARVTPKGKLPRGQSLLVASTGPMARDVDSLVAFMRAVLGTRTFRRDAVIPPIPFNETVYNDTKALKIGYYIDDGYFPASPAAARAVMVTKDILERQGHTLVPWTPPNVTKCMEAVFTSVSGDRGVIFSPMLSMDDVDPCISFLMDILTMNPVKRRLSYWFYTLTGNHELAGMYKYTAGKHSVGQWFTLVVETMTNFRKFEEDWHKRGLDALICPAGIGPATHLGEYESLMRYCSYTTIYNHLDVPAGIVPITKVTNADITAGYTGKGDVGDYIARTMDGAEGLPMAVQCVTMRWQEELCLRLMKDVERGRDQQKF